MTHTDLMELRMYITTIGLNARGFVREYYDGGDSYTLEEGFEGVALAMNAALSKLDEIEHTHLTRRCEFCEQEYLTTKKTQKYCSLSCKSKRHYRDKEKNNDTH